MERSIRRERPSFFFPILLITAGVIWLLVNNGVVPVENVYRLAPFWPVLLILGGLSVLLDQIWWPLNGLLWLAAAAAVVLAVLYPPAVLTTAVAAPEQTHEVFAEPVGGAKSADVSIDLFINPAKVSALPGGADLINADVYYTGEMSLDVTGTDKKTVVLEQQEAGVVNFRFPFMLTQPYETWNIGLTPSIPLDLTVDASTGSSDLDLSGLQLNSLRVKASTGSMDLSLPQQAERLPFTLDASTGSFEMVVPDGLPVEMKIDASTGSISIDVPDGAGVQVEVVNGGTGSLRLPDGFERASAGDDNKEGIWENDAYNTSKTPIQINIDMSTGSFTVR